MPMDHSRLEYKNWKFFSDPPDPPIQWWRKLSHPRTTCFATPHHCKRGEGNFSNFFIPSGKKKMTIFYFSHFCFLWKKTFFWKKCHFCNFSNFHFSFFGGWKNCYAKKGSLHSLKNVIIYHFLFAALLGSWFSTDGARPSFTVLI